MKKFIAAILISLLIFAAAIPCFAEETEEKTMQIGLHVGGDGAVTLNGQPFYGYGVNYFGAMNRFNDAYLDGFKGLAEHNIPFVRVPFAGWGPDFYDKYDAEKENVLKHMKDVLDTAAQYKIGVIVDVTWSDWAIPLHVGGKRADMAVSDSAVMKYVKDYVATVVSAFVNHPAVWGWEIGNEYNLTADLFDPAFKSYLWPEGVNGYTYEGVDGYDYFTSGELQIFYSEVAKVIREYDPYRMISTGNGEMRPAAYALNKSSGKMREGKRAWTMNWTQNTQKQFNTINAFYTPDPVDTMCFHLQHGTAGSANPAYVLEFGYFNKTISTLEYFKAYADAAKSAGKAIFFGEFGDLMDMENDADNMKVFRNICEWMTEAGIQIGASWQFQDYTEEGASGQKLDVLSELNLGLRDAGKQVIPEKWEEFVPETTAGETTAVEDVGTTASAVDESIAADETTATPESKGCGGTIAGVAAIATVALAGTQLKKKKERK